MKTFWLGGAYSENSKPPVNVCWSSYMPSGHTAHMYYDTKNKCAGFGENHDVHGAICHMNGFFPETKVRSQDFNEIVRNQYNCLLYTSPSPRDKRQSRMPSSA